MNTPGTWGRWVRLGFTGIGIPALLWGVSFLIIPFVVIVAMSLGWSPTAPSTNWTLHHFTRALHEPFTQIFVRSILFSTIATVCCLILAFPVCIFLLRMGREAGKKWLLLMMTPFLINFLVRIYAWFVMLRPEGIISRLLSFVGVETSLIASAPGMMLGLVYGYLPFMILPLWSVMEKLDPKIWEAAEDLGAPFFSILRRILIPQAMPGIVAGCILVGIPMLGEYCIPKLLGGGMIPTVGTTIESQFLAGVHPNWPFGAAIACILLVGIALLLWFCQRLLVIGLDQSPEEGA